MKTPLEWTLDHITVVAETLEDGVRAVKDQLGIDMPTGGKHPKMGTHNCLLALGDALFLEVIAIDPHAPAPTWPRWFNLDQFKGKPRLETWVLRSQDLQKSLAQAHPESGVATEITRDHLRWLISLAEDGAMPLEGAFPTLIEWPAGQDHPAAKMTDLGCRLRSLTIEHPKADEILTHVDAQMDMSQIMIKNGPVKKIQAEIETPDGLRHLA